MKAFVMRRERPLSPYLIYRFDYTMLWSFSHRITGVLLSVGSIMLAWWLLALASGPDAYARAMNVFGTGFFRLLLLGAVFSFFFHLANGVRHLLWDCGVGFEKRQARLSAWFVLLAALALTVLFVVAVLQRIGVTA